MRRNYDIFEKFPDGSSIWRACVSGWFDAQRKIEELAELSENECYAIGIEAGELVPFNPARSNNREQIRNRAKRIA